MLKLFMYEDPELGPRQVPSAEDPSRGLVELKPESVLRVDVEAGKVDVDSSMSSGSSSATGGGGSDSSSSSFRPLGGQIVYIFD
jgi:hypothetical protein